MQIRIWIKQIADPDAGSEPRIRNHDPELGLDNLKLGEIYNKKFNSFIY
jgi:hypothetical protein